MEGTGIRWTAERVLALAPDEASRRAGSRLASPGPWSEAGAGGGAVWGLCQGSGSRRYETVVDLAGADGPAFRCSCPSRKFPCKHALGLLLLSAEQATGLAGGSGERGEEGQEGGADGEGGAGGAGSGAGRDGPGARSGADAARPPEWAAAWLDDRRARTARAADRPAAEPETAPDGTRGTPGDDGPGSGRDPAPAARQRTGQRLRRMAEGAADVEERLADLLRGGLAGADRQGYAPWEEMAARMVDAQAPGLAARVRELGRLPATGPGWPARLLAECALLHLLCRGLRSLEDLPEPLAATVRTRAGLTVGSAGLLADEGARIRDEWLVLAQHDTAEGRLTARRVWLRGRRTDRPALLLSHAPAGRSLDVSFPAGSVIDAEVAYHPAARPLRVALGEHRDAAGPAFVPAGGTVTDALVAYGTALCDDPWLDAWPAVLAEVVPVPGDAEAARAWQLADAAGDRALPVAPDTPSSALWRLAALSGGEPLTVFGECGHRGFAPYTAWDVTGEAVPL